VVEVAEVVEEDEEQPAMSSAPPTTAATGPVTSERAMILRIIFPFPIDLLGYEWTIHPIGQVGNTPATLVTNLAG
jgi:hypothetical protein